MTPADIPFVHRTLKRYYDRKTAPIIEFIQVQTGSPFKVLVATILSARTRDETTTKAVQALFNVITGPADLCRLSLEEIEQRIFPVGFYHIKARHLKALGAMLMRDFGGSVPDTLEALCTLPGVGRKTANLVVTVAFAKYGICVDVHVHRISNRLGLVATRTPFETETALRRILPKRYWKHWNRQLVAFGQMQCTPRHPRCNQCPVAAVCDRSGVITKYPSP